MCCLSFFINKKIMCRHVPKVPYGSYAPGDIIFMQSAQSIHVNVYTQLTEMCPSYINIFL